MDKRIAVAQRLQPFSHVAGTKVVLPGSTCQLTIYPTLILIDRQEISIPLTGPVDDFTVQLDLEKGLVKVWGHYLEGFLRYKIQATTEGSFAITTEKSPVDNLFPENIQTIYNPQSTERLSLGNNKAQDWELVARRADICELFPFWFRLGQLLPDFPLDTTAGTASLLGICKERISEKDKLKICPSFLNLFRTGFEGILSPRLIDTQHQGFLLKVPGADFKGSSFALLTEGSKVIRSLFFNQNENQIQILPLLPPEFHSGRFVNISCGMFGTLDIEWTKKSIRRMVCHSRSNSEILFLFPKEINTFRLCERKNHNGEIISAGSPVSLQEGISYLFDNFK